MDEEESVETELEFYQTVLNKCRRKFVDHLDPNSLLDVFVEENFITNTDERDIQELKNTSLKNRRILTMVRSKGLNGYIRFKAYLRKCRQERLVEDLETVEVALQGAKIEDPNEKSSSRNKGYPCSVCDLSFATLDVLVQHITTKEHLDVIMKQQEFAKETIEETTEDISDTPDLSISNTRGEENVCDSIDQVDRCYICNITFTSPSHASSHLNGKSHKKKKALFDMRSDQSISKAASNNSCETEGELTNQPDSSILEFDKTSLSKNNVEPDENRFCKICNVPFTGIESAKQHYESDKHKKKARLLEKEKKGEVLPLSCDVCSLSFSGQENAEAHFASEKHKKKANTSQIENSTLSCSICNCSFSGPESAKAHFNSEKHKKKARTSQMESSSLSCKVCNCSFSGPESAAAHFNSVKHKKKEQKAKSEESAESLPMFCKICKCPFSGEDNAKQHFEGKKHMKALRLYEDKNLKDSQSSQIERATKDSNNTAQNADDNTAQDDVTIASQHDENSMPNTDVTNASEANTTQSGDDNTAQNDDTFVSQFDENNMNDTDTSNVAETDNIEEADNVSEDDIADDLERLLLGEPEEIK